MRNINVFIYSSLLISLFLKIRIYPLIMLIVVMMNTFLLPYKSKIKKYQILILIFLIYNLINYIFTPFYQTKQQNLMKLTLSFSYLMLFEYSFKSYKKDDFINFFIKINKVIEGLIILNFIQIIFLYIKKKISLLKLIFLQNSTDAYIINFENIYMFFGNENKNIWSTKVGLIFIIYMFVEKYILKRKLKSRIILMGCICILLILSRTGILLILLYFIIDLLLKIKKCNLYKKVTATLLSIPILYFLLKKIYFRIFRIDFTNLNDGGMTRLFNWNLFRLNFIKENYILGLGLGSTPEFLRKYNSILIDGHMHNVILNLTLELGIIGGITYTLIILKILLELKKKLKIKFLLLSIPFGGVLMLQYMGYDNDVVIYFSYIVLISNSISREENYENFISNSNYK